MADKLQVDKFKDGNIQKLIEASDKYTSQIKHFFSKNKSFSFHSSKTQNNDWITKNSSNKKRIKYDLCLNLTSKELEIFPVNLKQTYSFMQILCLNSNKFKVFPIEIKEFPCLKSLKIENNYIKKVTNNVFNYLSELEILSFSNNLIESIENLNNEFDMWSKKLVYFDLSINHLNKLPENIGKLSSLKSLKINNNDFLYIPSSLRNLSNLQEIHFEWFKYLKEPFKENLLCSDSKILKEGKMNQEMLHNFQTLLTNLEADNTMVCTFLDFINFFQLSVNLNKVSLSKNRTILHKAVLSEDISVIKSLIATNFRHMNLVDFDCHTALSLAIHEEKYFAAKLLIYNGADLKIGGGIAGNCLNLAIQKLQIYLVEDLLKLGLDPNSTDSNGNNSMHYLGSFYDLDCDKSEKIAQNLLLYGVNLNKKNLNKLTPLHLAITNQQIGMFTFLMNTKKYKNNNKTDASTTRKTSYELDLNILGGCDKMSALHFAVKSSNLLFTNELLLNGANPNIYDKYSRRPLTICRNLGILKFLFKYEKLYFNEKLKSQKILEKSTEVIRTDFDEDKNLFCINNLILGCNQPNKIEIFNKINMENISKQNNKMMTFKRSNSTLSVSKIQSSLNEFQAFVNDLKFAMEKNKKLLIEGYNHYTLTELSHMLNSFRILRFQHIVKKHKILQDVESSRLSLLNFDKMMDEILNSILKSYLQINEEKSELLIPEIIKSIRKLECHDIKFEKKSMLTKFEAYNLILLNKNIFIK